MSDYHLRRTEKELKDPAELRAVLLRQRYLTIAMCRAGQPLPLLKFGYGLCRRIQERCYNRRTSPAGRTETIREAEWEAH